ncbi:MAG: hypothetical protein ACRCUE_15800 [Bosea sp. (in: a-proteobacteria)]
MSEAIQAALYASGATALLAILGYWITFKTSTHANLEAIKFAALSKKAEFRQHWINELRRSVSEFIKESHLLVHANMKMINQEDFARFSERQQYILMLLTSDETQFEELRNAIRTYVDVSTKGKAASGDQHFAARKALNDATRVVIKREWEVIKKELSGK